MAERRGLPGQVGRCRGSPDLHGRGGKHLSDTWDAASTYDLSVHGPNGFCRGFKGGRQANLDVESSYDERYNEISLMIRNRGSEAVTVAVLDRYTSRARTLSLKPGEVESEQRVLSRKSGTH